MKAPQSKLSANVWQKIVKELVSRIKSAFEPEEVEVTFRQEGNRMTYSYTKISRKKAA